VGAGVGYLVSYLVAAVGEKGKVIAQDIHADFLGQVRQKIINNGWTNVEVVLGTEKNPKLPPSAIDAAIVLDTYHHLDYPDEMLRGIGSALKPNGRLIIVDFYRSRKHPGATAEDLKSHVRADRDEVIREVAARGFRLERHFDHLPHEYILIFRNVL
jgi:ubiquinone/menaquinone biosynthesis C-methylase UbiE